MTAPRLAAAGPRLAAALLGAGCVIWADTGSAVAHKGDADLALFLAIFGVAAGVIRLALAGVPVPEDTFLHGELEDYFPAPLRERFAAQMASHPLRREIIATRLTRLAIMARAIPQ